MSIEVPRCFERGCIHFIGVVNDADDISPESGERPICKAFEDGIPSGIAYGNNLHNENVIGDNGIKFESRKS